MSDDDTPNGSLNQLVVTFDIPIEWWDEYERYKNPNLRKSLSPEKQHACHMIWEVENGKRDFNDPMSKTQ